MPLTRFLKPFWISSATATMVAILFLFPFRASRADGSGGWKSFPFSRETYPMSSGSGIVDHALFRYGFLGFGKRIESSEVVLAGTSHALFGLSAGILSEKLSDASHRHVPVFNLGLGFGESAFTAHFFERNRIRDKWLLLDLNNYQKEGSSEWGSKIEQNDVFSAGATVATVWIDALWRWGIDPILPRFELDSKGLHCERFLSATHTRRWDNGDTGRIWTSAAGTLYERGVPPLSTMNHPKMPGMGRVSDMATRHMGLPIAWRQVIEANHLRPILILLPYEGDSVERAKAIAQETGYPLVIVPDEGLTFLDHDHLTAASRDEATLRVWNEIERRKLIPLPLPRP